MIEERQEVEVTHFGERRTAPEGIKVRNPAFDVTPHSSCEWNHYRKANHPCSLCRKSTKALSKHRMKPACLTQ